MHGVASDIAPRRSPYGASTTPTPTRADVFELIQSDDGESLEALTRAQPRLALDRITDNGTDEKEALIFAGVQYAPPPEVVFRNAFDEALPGFLCFGFGMGEVACRCGGTLRIRLGDDLHAVAKRNGKSVRPTSCTAPPRWRRSNPPTARRLAPAARANPPRRRGRSCA